MERPEFELVKIGDSAAATSVIGFNFDEVRGIFWKIILVIQIWSVPIQHSA